MTAGPRWVVRVRCNVATWMGHLDVSQSSLSVTSQYSDLGSTISFIKTRPRYEYHWQDGVNYKRPTKLSAPGNEEDGSRPTAGVYIERLRLNSIIIATHYPSSPLPAEYVDQLMNWVQGMLDDEEIFPSKIGGW